MGAHSAVAAMVRTAPATIQALRQGSIPGETRAAALVVFTRAVVQQRGWVGEEALNAFLADGYTGAQVLEVLVIVALKTLSNYTNHLAQTPLDEAFAAHRWTRRP